VCGGGEWWQARKGRVREITREKDEGGPGGGDNDISFRYFRPLRDSARNGRPLSAAYINTHPYVEEIIYPRNSIPRARQPRNCCAIGRAAIEIGDCAGDACGARARDSAMNRMEIAAPEPRAASCSSEIAWVINGAARGERREIRRRDGNSCRARLLVADRGDDNAHHDRR